MTRLHPRVKMNLPVKIETKLEKALGIVVNLSVDGALLRSDKRDLEDTVLLKYNLPDDGNFEHSGKIIRREGDACAVKFHDIDAAAKENLWKYLAGRLHGTAICPYCGEEYGILPLFCNSCGWKLTFNSPDYFEYHKKQSLLKRLYAEAEKLAPDKLKKLINFIGVEILKERVSEGLQEFVGTSPAMLEVFSKIRKVAPTELPVLILGESGTGKELTAHAIHERSMRRNKPLITINCAAIPEGLLEAELFGYERGSFTGAYTSKKGKFEYADSGTIFLDEIGDMPLNLQTKLLRFLQDGIVERIGSVRGRKLDVRLIAATNCNLASAIEAGRFRVDLYYRLDAFTIHLPAVREREEDKAVLAKYFLKKFCRETGVAKKFGESAIEAIKAYSWPGNVREMINKVRRAVVVAERDTISPQDLSIDAHGLADTSKDILLKNIREKIEVQKVVEAINLCGSISEAAKRLGISRSSLYNYKKKYCV